MLNNIMIEVYSSSNNMEWNTQGLPSSDDNNVNPSSWIFQGWKSGSSAIWNMLPTRALVCSSSRSSISNTNQNHQTKGSKRGIEGREYFKNNDENSGTNRNRKRFPDGILANLGLQTWGFHWFHMARPRWNSRAKVTPLSSGFCWLNGLNHRVS